MTTVEMKYGAVFGKCDASDWFEYEVELEGEAEAAYLRAKNAIVHYLMASSWHYSEKAAEDLMQMREDYVVEAFLSKEPIEDAAVEVGYCCG